MLSISNIYRQILGILSHSSVSAHRKIDENPKAFETDFQSPFSRIYWLPGYLSQSLLSREIKFINDISYLATKKNYFVFNVS